MIAVDDPVAWDARGGVDARFDLEVTTSRGMRHLARERRRTGVVRARTVCRDHRDIRHRLRAAERERRVDANPMARHVQPRGRRWQSSIDHRWMTLADSDRATT